VGQWRLVFFIAAANSIAGCIIYLMFGTSKVQPWNQYAKLNSKEQKLALETVKCEKTYETENTNDIRKTNFIKER